MRGAGLQITGRIVGVNTAAVLQTAGPGRQRRQRLLLIAGPEGNHVTAAQIVLAIEIGVIGRVVVADKIGGGTLGIEAAANDLFDLTLVQVDAGAKKSHGGLLC